MMNHDRIKEKLLETINIKRQEMIEMANREGYTSENAVKCSQDLDLLLNNYQKLLQDEKNRASGSFYGVVKTVKMWTMVDYYSLQFVEK